MRLDGNHVLITGGGSGIGLALAEAFLEAGSKVAICGRREDRLAAARAKHPKFLTRVCDVADNSSRVALRDWVGEAFPSINVLVNNAGVQRDIDFTRGADEYFAGENEISVNLESAIVLTGLFAPLLAHKDGAAILNVTSGLGFVPAAKMPVYSATKAGLHAFSLASRWQLSKVGIKVIEIVPPAVDTDLNPEGRAKRGGFKPDLGPGEFVAAVMKGLQSDVNEIGYGTSAGFASASRADLDRSLQTMNSRM